MRYPASEKMEIIHADYLPITVLQAVVQRNDVQDV